MLQEGFASSRVKLKTRSGKEACCFLYRPTSEEKGWLVLLMTPVHTALLSMSFNVVSGFIATFCHTNREI